jgi:hypothetical protein
MNCFNYSFCLNSPSQYINRTYNLEKIPHHKVRIAGEILFINESWSNESVDIMVDNVIVYTITSDSKSQHLPFLNCIQGLGRIINFDMEIEHFSKILTVKLKHSSESKNLIFGLESKFQIYTISECPEEFKLNEGESSICLIMDGGYEIFPDFLSGFNPEETKVTRVFEKKFKICPTFCKTCTDSTTCTQCYSGLNTASRCNPDSNGNLLVKKIFKIQNPNEIIGISF